jgi:hypothetical protein
MAKQVKKSIKKTSPKTAVKNVVVLPPMKEWKKSTAKEKLMVYYGKTIFKGKSDNRGTYTEYIPKQFATTTIGSRSSETWITIEPISVTSGIGGDYHFGGWGYDIQKYNGHSYQKMASAISVKTTDTITDWSYAECVKELKKQLAKLK